MWTDIDQPGLKILRQDASYYCKKKGAIVLNCEQNKF